MHSARIAALAFALAAACGTTSTPPDGGAPADGGGVCCPIVGSPPCGCAGGGGWAPSADQCPSQGGACDAWFDVTTDSHGCSALSAQPSKCCGCPPPQDAAADAPADVTDE